MESLFFGVPLPPLDGAGCQPLSTRKGDRDRPWTLHPPILRDLRSRVDPTLTLPLPRGGDRKCS
ncbi:hypothetical protein [Oscillatoria sp. HE19RPO]|uniref:hypothetical protein n=1 Tax=Oscillatoria sp. HE19RPO TaxID=2954806 RepID=UPI0020C3C196|nr:hypothetical protein [Oscillatoria sp. HE19RPO]